MKAGDLLVPVRGGKTAMPRPVAIVVEADEWGDEITVWEFEGKEPIIHTASFVQLSDIWEVDNGRG